MKKVFLIIGFLTSILISHSQDVIYLKDKTEIQAIVREINDSHILYHSFDQPDGATNKIEKKNVALIIYQNGSREVFIEESNLTDNVAINRLQDSTPATIVFIVYAKVKVEYFHNNKYIGKTKNSKCLKYKCVPGKQLIWASEKNKEFLACDLKPGGTYIVNVIYDTYGPGLVGTMSGRVRLEPRNENSFKKPKHYERFKKLVQKAKWMKNTDEDIRELNIELKEFIDEKLKMYESEWKFDHTKIISPDMAITDKELIAIINN